MKTIEMINQAKKHYYEIFELSQKLIAKILEELNEKTGLTFVEEDNYEYDGRRYFRAKEQNVTMNFTYDFYDFQINDYTNNTELYYKLNDYFREVFN